MTSPNGLTLGVSALIAILLLGLGRVAPAEFLAHFSVFVLACFVGWQVVWNVAGSHSVDTTSVKP